MTLPNVGGHAAVTVQPSSPAGELAARIERRSARLALCDLTARTIRQGLSLLGIDVVEKM